MNTLLAIILSVVFWVVSYFFGNRTFYIEGLEPSIFDKFIFTILGAVVIAGSFTLTYVLYALIYSLIS